MTPEYTANRKALDAASALREALYAAATLYAAGVDRDAQLALYALADKAQGIVDALGARETALEQAISADNLRNSPFAETLSQLGIK